MITKLFYKGIEKKLLSNLINADNSVEIAVAWFTNPAIFDLLIELINRNIRIHIILCDDIMNFANPKTNFQKLIDLGANIRVSKSPKLMHNKFCIIDNRILITGSYNWTLRAEKLNLENIIISTDKQLINEFQSYFDYLLKNTSPVINIPKSTFNSFLSKKEMELELQLEENKLDLDTLIEPEKIIENNPELKSEIDKADLLYLNAKHEECVQFCKKMIKKHPTAVEFHLILASSYWRLNKNNKLIDSAKKAISMNNELYDAYNLLGIGYSRIKGKEQQSVKNYNICLKKYPKEHAFLRNRALSFIALESDVNIPKKFRDDFKEKANKDLNTIITSLNRTDDKNLDFASLHSRAIAYSQLNKLNLAQKDIDLALKVYNKTTNKFALDKNELIEMKYLQRELRHQRKASR